jgi:hypothetical protein
MSALVAGNIDINPKSQKLDLIFKNDLAKSKRTLELERIKNLDYNKLKPFLKTYEEVNLSNYDYKEIEKSINEDKKICENCKTNIYENNYHKGWKNDQGEYVLLCTLCSKKYFNGALEIIFDGPKRSDDIIIKPRIEVPEPMPISSGSKIYTNH